ncbi:MAG: glycoside hydrolase family 16 protein [Mucilaginibacter sp.]
MKFLFTSALLICATVLCAQPKGDTLFYENFNSPSLNRTVWNVEVTGHTVNNEQQAYVDSANTISIANGMLHITPVYHPGYISNQQRKYDFLSGRINTRGKFEFTYGTATARIKMSAGAGLWPAFWALGEGKWPDCGEIDMMENVGDSSWISHALHGPGYFGNTPLAYRYHFPAGKDVTQWHIYSVKWTPDSLIFSVDGRITYTVTKAMTDHYGRWAYDNPKFIILNFALGGGYPQGVNKVTTPYSGLPQSTVDKIKHHEAQMQVDWVLVTKN